MVDAPAGTVTTDRWSELLASTREALSRLRAPDLEELVMRAEAMRADWASNPNKPVADLAAMRRDHDRLRDLLAATDSNMRVVRRSHRYIRENSAPWPH